jgi:hypothetical protein
LIEKSQKRLRTEIEEHRKCKPDEDEKQREMITVPGRVG